MDIRKKEYGRLVYAINNYNKPITRNRINQIVRVLYSSKMNLNFGCLPNDLIKILKPGSVKSIGHDLTEN